MSVCGIVMIILAVTFIVAGGSVASYLVRFRKLFPRLNGKYGRRNEKHAVVSEAEERDGAAGCGE